jgi:hypothetical protein
LPLTPGQNLFLEKLAVATDNDPRPTAALADCRHAFFQCSHHTGSGVLIAAAQLRPPRNVPDKGVERQIAIVPIVSAEMPPFLLGKKPGLMMANANAWRSKASAWVARRRIGLSVW